MSRHQQAGLYIHIPFCVSKCVYCDFLSFATTGDGYVDGYVNGYVNGYANEHVDGYVERYTAALINELRLARTTYLRDTLFDTVYIGGGTPTALPAPFLRDVISEAAGFALTEDAEFTVEANPGTLSAELLAMLRANGVNRLSIGLQARQDDLLAMLGRAHRLADFTENFMAAKAAGFTNINVDLMFALPGQSMADWQATLAYVAGLAPTHISAYALTPEEDTPLWRQLQNGERVLPTEEIDRAMYRWCGDFLSQQGYTQYELSNYARPGLESRHNTKYWRRVPYYGFGLGAHSFDGATRWHNTTSLAVYIDAEGKHLAREDREVLTPAEAMSEAMFLGLRLTEGVSVAEFEAAFGMPMAAVYGDGIKRLTAEGLLIQEGGYLRLTPKGMDLANRVFVEFIEFVV